MGVGVSLYRHRGAQGGRSAYPQPGPFDLPREYHDRELDEIRERVAGGWLDRVKSGNLPPSAHGARAFSR